MEQNKCNKLRLLLHQKNYTDEDVLVSSRALGPNIKSGDIIEVYDSEQDHQQPRLLLQVPNFEEEHCTKDSISIEQNIASTFQLHSYKDVIVSKVEPESVAIELLELTFKDQYFARPDMWRLKRNLVNTVMYLHKKIDFCKGSLRCQVYEMWSQGEKVACGAVTENTKVVFRSFTCQAYLFIQMSSEMWEHDMHGDLYFEKAVNGFLAELFARWKAEGSNHDVTIVFFSRTYYKATSIDEFPECVRQCLQEDYMGRFYEDFYRVAIQNERFDDWTPILSHLRRLFHNYLPSVLEYHSAEEIKVPEAYNSNAAQGNFLEVLNISLNVFEKHYQDRSFERTGQMSVVLTPGVGVFEVDRNLTNITNQRIIDNGVGSDLVCVGEQPLHAVPLLKFHKKRGSKIDDYSMPNTWINLSFYVSNKRKSYGNFVPRIKVPAEIIKICENTKYIRLPSIRSGAEEAGLLGSVFDYDAYDAQVFKYPTNQNSRANRNQQRTPTKRKPTSHSTSQPQKIILSRKLSDSDLYRNPDSLSSSVSDMTVASANKYSQSPAINIPSSAMEYKFSKSFSGLNLEGPSRLPLHTDLDDISPSHISKVGSSGTNSPNEHSHLQSQRLPTRPRRSLINPFDPSHVTIKRTSYRRRWIHIFPKGPSGVLIQPHYYQPSPNNTSTEDEREEILMSAGHKRKTIQKENIKPGFPPSTSENTNRKQSTLLWGATGEQEWNAEMKTAVDWKSLSLPACFPLTTDYFPDNISLPNDYVVAANYSLLPDEFNPTLKTKKCFTNYLLFLELVSQRLSQGFQLIFPYDEASNGQRSLMMSNKKNKEIREYKLSIGRVFHRVICNDSSINVTVYKPRHPYPQLDRRYKYRFRSPYLSNYEVSWGEFKTERLETYKWNYLDNYICFRGAEIPLQEDFKYWRIRLLIVPDCHKHITKKLMDATANTRCDIFHKISVDEQTIAMDSFLRFFEVIHRIKNIAKKGRPSVVSRERLGSNKMNEKARLSRSGNKDKVRFESGSKEDSVFRSNDNEEDWQMEGKKFNSNSSLLDIVDAMRDSTSGVHLLDQQPGLSPNTFISVDATRWVCQNFDDIQSESAAINIMQELVTNNLIRHASGERHLYYVHGFYLYSFVNGSKEADSVVYDSFSYRSEWHEVAIEPFNNRKGNALLSPSIPPRPSFLLQDLTHIPDDNSFPRKVSALFKSGNIDIDVTNKSERYEWGHLKYQSKFSPLEGYEMVLQWLCATGTLVNDLVYSWQRKAMTCGLHLFPIPSDPFALPLSYKSNPLRNPIVIPLNIECLQDKGQDLFHEFTPESRPKRMRIFQEHILERYGFLKFQTEVDSKTQTQYVNVTANMLVLIQSIDLDKPEEAQSSATLADIKAGFLWTFNYMLSRRWKSALSGDEALGERILKDFEEFCFNDQNRLKYFWDSLVHYERAPFSEIN